MLDYEETVWQSEYLCRNTETLRCHLDRDGHGDLAEAVSRLAKKPGPLNAFLAGRYWEFSAAKVVARFAASIRSGAPRAKAEDIVDSLMPLLHWDYGMEPIEWALREFEALTGARLPAMGDTTPSGIGEAVEALWVLGLYRFTLQPEDPKSIPFTGLLQAGSEVELPQLREEALGRLGRLMADLGRPPAGAPVSARERLWLNAAAMLRRHTWLEGGCPDVFRELASHASSGGTWPLPCAANDDVRAEAAAHGLIGFWQEKAPLALTAPYMLEVGFLTDPLEILNLDNAFDTCLRVGADSVADACDRYDDRKEAGVLGYATNANIRIVVARGADGRILASRALGLSFCRGGGVVEAPTYPKGHAHLASAIETFVEGFMAEAELRRVGTGLVRQTCAPFYDEFPKPAHTD